LLAVVIPANNEEKNICRVIYNLHVLRPGLIIPVVNGCSDNTLPEALKAGSDHLQILYYKDALGIDMPRALGALYAFNHGASRVIFVDGDMVGSFQKHLLELDRALLSGTHMALTNCYPYITTRQPLTSMVLQFRARLNIALGMYARLGLASPSHGPHGISREVFAYIPVRELAVPPVSLVFAVKYRLSVKVATALPHAQLGSPSKGDHHSEKIAATLIGDCLEGLSILAKKPRSRCWEGTEYTGYHDRRRFDILDEHLKKKVRWTVFRPRK